jgi:hypothetical protein
VGRAPINRRLADEFFEAVREYVRWAFGHPKQPLPFSRYIQLSLVCGRVNDSSDLLPQDAFDTLMMLAIEDLRSKEELRANRTYATAARILTALIDAKRQGPDCSLARIEKAPAEVDQPGPGSPERRTGGSTQELLRRDYLAGSGKN